MEQSSNPDIVSPSSPSSSSQPPLTSPSSSPTKAFTSLVEPQLDTATQPQALKLPDRPRRRRRSQLELQQYHQQELQQYRYPTATTTTTSTSISTTTNTIATTENNQQPLQADSKRPHPTRFPHPRRPCLAYMLYRRHRLEKGRSLFKFLEDARLPSESKTLLPPPPSTHSTPLAEVLSTSSMTISTTVSAMTTRTTTTGITAPLPLEGTTSPLFSSATTTATIPPATPTKVNPNDPPPPPLSAKTAQRIVDLWREEPEEVKKRFEAQAEMERWAFWREFPEYNFIRRHSLDASTKASTRKNALAIGGHGSSSSPDSFRPLQPLSSSARTVQQRAMTTMDVLAGHDHADPEEAEVENKDDFDDCDWDVDDCSDLDDAEVIRILDRMAILQMQNDELDNDSIGSGKKNASTTATTTNSATLISSPSSSSTFSSSALYFEPLAL